MRLHSGAASTPSPPGMVHQEFHLQLTRYAERGWRAKLLPPGLAHSVVKGTDWAETPWGAVQRAAGRCLTGVAWTCRECGCVLSDADEECLRALLALDAVVTADADDLEMCGACRWRYGPRGTIQ